MTNIQRIKIDNIGIAAYLSTNGFQCGTITKKGEYEFEGNIEDIQKKIDEYLNNKSLLDQCAAIETLRTRRSRKL